MVSPSFRYGLDEARGLLVAHGDLGESATMGLRETIAAATDQLRSGLVIDLSDIDFLPSSAVGVLAAAQATARRNGAEIVFVASQGSIAQRVLQICGLGYLDAVPGTSDPA